MLIIGFFMPGIDNYAHIGGFAGGYLAARVLDPLKPERIDHCRRVACLPCPCRRRRRLVSVMQFMSVHSECSVLNM